MAPPFQRIIALGLLLIVAIVPIVAPSGARAGTGPLLRGYGTPTLDGVITESEWSGAEAAGIRYVWIDVGGAVTLSKLFVMNDDEFLYFGLRIPIFQRDPSWYKEFSVKFDRAADGLVQLGDDGFVLTPSGVFIDAFIRDTRCAPGPAFELAPDADDAGTNEGAGAVTRGPSYASYEARKPLRSEDTKHDFSLAVGDVIGWNAKFTFNVGNPVGIDSYFTGADDDPTTWGSIEIVGADWVPPTSPPPSASGSSATPTPSGTFGPSPTPGISDRPTPQPSFTIPPQPVALGVEIVVPQEGHPIADGVPENIRARLSTADGVSTVECVSVTVGGHTAPVQDLRHNQQNPDVLGAKVATPTSAPAGTSTLELCVRVSTLGGGTAYGCGSLSVLVMR